MEVGSWQFWVGFVVVIVIAFTAGWFVTLATQAPFAGFVVFAAIFFVAGLLAHIIDGLINGFTD